MPSKVITGTEKFVKYEHAYSEISEKGKFHRVFGKILNKSKFYSITNLNIANLQI